MATIQKRKMKTGHYFGAAKLKTLDDLCDKYIPVAKSHLKSWVEVERQLEWWKAQAGSEILDAITSARIAEWRDELLATPKQRGGGKRSAADVNRTIAALIEHRINIPRGMNDADDVNAIAQRLVENDVPPERLAAQSGR